MPRRPTPPNYPASPARHESEQARQRQAEASFLATVVSKSGTSITVRRWDSDTAEGPYVARAGLAASVSAGDTVKCEQVGGSIVVAYEVP